MSGKHDVHAVFEEQRLELFAQRDIRTVRTARGVDRMMEVHDLPVRAARRQLLFDPLQLGAIHVIAVERKEPYAGPGPEGVVPLAVHVEQLEHALIRAVVIAERRVELDALVEDGLVGNLELLLEVARAFAAIHVVAHHQHELVREALIDVGEHLREPVLIRISSAAVTDDREPQRSAALVRNGQILRGNGDAQRGGDRQNGYE